MCRSFDMDLASPLPAAANAVSPSRRPSARPLFVFVLFLLGLAVEPPVASHVRAARLLLAFQDAGAATAGGVREEILTFAAPRGEVRARVFVPEGAVRPPAMVLIHGVHRKGIDEPRLLRFSRALSRAGVTILTPEVVELSDYVVEARSIDTVGAAMVALALRTGHERVGVMGMSFGGGIALLTAADPRYRDVASVVVAVGAHHDMARVSRFFAGQPATGPDGATSPVQPHAYGGMVLLHARVAEFFPAEDVPAARESIKLWLWEERDRARAEAKKLSPSSQARVETLFAGDLEGVRPTLLHAIDGHAAEMAAVSPRDKLADIQADVFLLHGAGDTVIPATETAWLAREVPPARLRQAIVSPAIVHVELEGTPTTAQKWQLVHFMGDVLLAADRRGR